MLTDAIASVGGSTIKSISVRNNNGFTCPGQVLCAVMDETVANANRFSVIISKNVSGYYLAFLAISGATMTVSQSSALSAKVFYI